jgi:hypothetical protein
MGRLRDTDRRGWRVFLGLLSACTGYGFTVAATEAAAEEEETVAAMGAEEATG